MHKEYKVNFMKSSYPLVVALGMLLTIVSLYGVYVMIHNYARVPVVLLCIGFTMPMVFLFIAFLGLFYFNKLEVYIDDENIIYKMPDKTRMFKIRDIYKIERTFSYAGVGYYIFYYDDRHYKKHILLNDNIAGHAELLEYLQRKSDVKMRWEGTLDVEKEKRPAIKVLKIIYNIIITLLIIGLTVAYPFMTSMHRDKEHRLHLPERSLWP